MNIITYFSNSNSWLINYTTKEHVKELKYVEEIIYVRFKNIETQKKNGINTERSEQGQVKIVQIANKWEIMIRAMHAMQKKKHTRGWVKSEISLKIFKFNL